jgi:hypothetical protein
MGARMALRRDGYVPMIIRIAVIRRRRLRVDFPRWQTTQDPEVSNFAF